MIYRRKKQPGRLSLKTWARLLPFLKKIRGHIVAVWCSCSFPPSRNRPSRFLRATPSTTSCHARTTEGLVPFALLFLAVIVFEGVTVMFFARRAITVEMFLGRVLRRESFVHLQKLPVSFYQHDIGGLSHRARHVRRGQDLRHDRLGPFPSGVEHMLSRRYFIFMFALNARLALLLLAVVPVLVFITWIYQKRLIVINRRVRAVNAQITGAFNEGIYRRESLEDARDRGAEHRLSSTPSPRKCTARPSKAPCSTAVHAAAHYVLRLGRRRRRAVSGRRTGDERPAGLRHARGVYLLTPSG